jgi:uncharacterized membrane protein
VSKYNNAERTDQVTVLASDEINIAQAVVTTVATVGVIAAGVALLEIALIPGMVIGGAAVLGPRLLPNYLPKNFSGLRRRLKPLLDFSPPIASKASLPKGSLQSLPVVRAPLPVQFTIKQAIAKTITYRIIVTTLDFTVNYVVIGELATAAGLSAFALVVGPLFYLAHEAVWNRFGDSDKRVDLTFLMPLRPGAETPSAEPRGFTISRALAKTVTFSHHRDDDGLHHQLRGCRRSRDGGDAVRLRLHPGSLRLSRPRNGVGLLWLVRRAHERTAGARHAAARTRLGALLPAGECASGGDRVQNDLSAIFPICFRHHVRCEHRPRWRPCHGHI